MIPAVERSRHSSVREIAALIFGYGPATVQPEAKRVPKQRRSNGRNPMIPAVACSRHGSVREFRLPVVGSGDCPTGSQTRPKEKAFERKESK
jgi:hypothetical protein